MRSRSLSEIQQLGNLQTLAGWQKSKKSKKSLQGLTYSYESITDELL